MSNVCLIVTSTQEDRFREFFNRWNAVGLFSAVDLYVMEDGPILTFDMDNLPYKGPEFPPYHFSWKSIRINLDVDEWIISRRSNAVRSFAAYQAWKAGYEYILTLDDDCCPCIHADGLEYSGPGFIGEHLKQLNNRARWFNTLAANIPRGIPYENVGKSQIILNHGLWTNSLDLDAPHQLVDSKEERHTFDSRVVPAGLYFPMSGKNVMWRADYTVLMYNPLMGMRVGAENDRDGFVPLPFDHFGDIWAGILMKKIADHLGLLVTTGMPYVRSENISDRFANLRKEASGIMINEMFWEYIDTCNLSSYRTPVECYAALGRHVGIWNCPNEFRDYFVLLGEAMVRWSKLFEEK